MTLSKTSSDATPGYPAPLIACMLTALIRLMPNRFSGARAITTGVVVQLGLVTSAPVLQPRRRRWTSISPRWSALTSGINSGTSSAMRWDLTLEHTTYPAAASSSSRSVAISPGSAEKISGVSGSASSGRTVRAATSAGGAPVNTQFVASA